MTGLDLGHARAGSPDANDIDPLDAGEPLKVGQGKKERGNPAICRARPAPSGSYQPELE